MQPIYLCTFDNNLGNVELKTLLSLHHLWSAYNFYLCVICNSNRFHSFIFKICIMIVHTLKMCTGDAGREQSLVLFFFGMGLGKTERIYLSWMNPGWPKFSKAEHELELGKTTVAFFDDVASPFFLGRTKPGPFATSAFLICGMA